MPVTESRLKREKKPGRPWHMKRKKQHGNCSKHNGSTLGASAHMGSAYMGLIPWAHLRPQKCSHHGDPVHEVEQIQLNGA